ncbi:hypothetical protein IDH44_08150 [Paenibacillus sp. IB182496]|uniref:Uncharacterized protein n=1 Tax=Paenibacillus sabuli TaxID=2772509 RepID=A0A927GRD0_9BACL|nr:hypothetical protein [Paenibacillus sabuli]MBD2845161.1 hypothetical protein [Paenibacillus sabuli]
MDKQKVIAAYRHGTITLQECAQILGIDSARLAKLIDDLYTGADAQAHARSRSVGS